MKNNTTVHGGIGFFGLLQIAFIVLKLCKIITWSWFWVLSPTLFIILIIVLFIIFFIWLAS